MDDRSQELGVLIDALDDLSILFFSDETLDYTGALFDELLKRHEESTSQHELPLLFEKCFERYPALKVNCFKLINQLIPDAEVGDIDSLINVLMDDSHWQLASNIVCYSFKELIPEGAKRDIPESIITLDRQLADSALKAPVSGLFHPPSPTISKADATASPTPPPSDSSA